MINIWKINKLQILFTSVNHNLFFEGKCKPQFIKIMRMSEDMFFIWFKLMNMLCLEINYVVANTNCSILQSLFADECC